MQHVIRGNYSFNKRKKLIQKYFIQQRKTETNNICKKRNLRQATLSLRRLLYTVEAKKTSQVNSKQLYNVTRIEIRIKFHS
jgi:hypothetical protein